MGIAMSDVRCLMSENSSVRAPGSQRFALARTETGYAQLEHSTSLHTRYGGICEVSCHVASAYHGSPTVKWCRRGGNGRRRHLTHTGASARPSSNLGAGTHRTTGMLACKDTPPSVASEHV